jgi:hypothetical protein
MGSSSRTASPTLLSSIRKALLGEGRHAADEPARSPDIYAALSESQIVRRTLFRHLRPKGETR